MLKNAIKKFILPSGVIHPKYLNYVKWSCFSNVVISMENVLGTHSMLNVLGKSSTELTLSVNFIGKDLIGQLGALTYISKMGKKADSDTKKFIKYSMILQQSSCWLESLTPFLPINVFILVAGFSNIMMNISFTGFGAINAKIISRLAFYEEVKPDQTSDIKEKQKLDNIGEIYSKLSVINTFGSSFGMSLGLAVIAIVPDHSTRLCILPVLTMLRIYSYNKAIEDLLD